MNGKQFYSIEQFVERLEQAGIAYSVRTVRHWIKTGRIKAFRPGQRQWYIPASELDKVLGGPAFREEVLEEVALSRDKRAPWFATA